MSIHRCGLFVGKLKLCVFGILIGVLLVAVPITMIDTLKKSKRNQIFISTNCYIKSFIKINSKFPDNTI